MKTRFGVPAAVALSVHVFALFGFRPPPHKTPAIPDPTSTCRLPVTFFPDPPEPPQPDEDMGASARGEPAASRSEEPLVVPRDQANPFLVERVETPPGPIAHTALIPAGPIGVPDGNGIGPVDGIISARGLDNAPRTRFQAAPTYPFEARNEGRRGEVLVEFVVDENGRVLNPRIVHSNDAIFEGPTLRAVSKWQFEPGRKNGRPVRFRMALPVQFSVSET